MIAMGVRDQHSVEITDNLGGRDRQRDQRIAPWVGRVLHRIHGRYIA
jgi:hypothetical protein